MRLIPAIILAAAVMAALIVLNRHDAAVRRSLTRTAEARADTLRDLREQSERLQDSLTAARRRAAADSIRADSLGRRAERLADSLSTAAVHASVRAVQAGLTLFETLDSVRVLLPPDSRQLADSAHAQAVRQREALRDALGDLEDVASALRGQLALRDTLEASMRRRQERTDSALDAYRTRLAAQLRQTETWRKAANPPFWSRLAGNASVLVVGAATGAVLTCAMTC